MFDSFKSEHNFVGQSSKKNFLFSYLLENTTIITKACDKTVAGWIAWRIQYASVVDSATEKRGQGHIKK